MKNINGKNKKNGAARQTEVKVNEEHQWQSLIELCGLILTKNTKSPIE